jgi:hypothetical protein
VPKKSYAEFVRREKGPEEWPALTVECQTSYEPAFDGHAGQAGELLSSLPRGACVFDRAGKCWRILPAYFGQAVEIAKKHFSHVYVRDGEVLHDLVTGQSFVQERLF